MPGVPKKEDKQKPFGKVDWKEPQGNKCLSTLDLKPLIGQRKVV